MSKNAVICAIEHALKDDGCNEVFVSELHARVEKLRGCLDIGICDFMEVLNELERDGLFEYFGGDDESGLPLLVARSQMHPINPIGKPINL